MLCAVYCASGALASFHNSFLQNVLRSLTTPETEDHGINDISGPVADPRRSDAPSCHGYFYQVVRDRADSSRRTATATPTMRWWTDLLNLSGRLLQRTATPLGSDS
jgi:hypothetical protein